MSTQGDSRQPGFPAIDASGFAKMGPGGGPPVSGGAGALVSGEFLYKKACLWHFFGAGKEGFKLWVLGKEAGMIRTFVLADQLRNFQFPSTRGWKSHWKRRRDSAGDHATHWCRDPGIFLLCM